MLAWPLAAFGGVYSWAYVPLAAGCALLALVIRPRFERDMRALDLALCAAIGVGVLQLVPLPGRLMAVLASGNLAAHEALTLGAVPSFIALSIDRPATVRALTVFSTAVVLYWIARRMFVTGGVRQVCRAVGWLGLGLACVSIVQLGASRGRIYGFWTPQQIGAWPYGPFVNRNHAATWLIMAIPVGFGYLVARVRSAAMPRHDASGLRQALDPRTLWLIASVVVMLIALALSLSRSGMIALVLSSGMGALLARGRADSVRSAWAAAVLLLGIVGILLFADTIAVVNRFAESAQGASGRMHIWRDTLTMARALWVAGSGVGTYATAMVIFQTGDRTYYFNHAHNHFLQVAAEGGLLMSIAVCAALVALAAVARRRLVSEKSGLVWIRGGAAAGLLAVAVQSLWETGLRIPANAMLAAVLTALLTHESRVAVESRSATWR